MNNFTSLVSILSSTHIRIKSFDTIWRKIKNKVINKEINVRNIKNIADAYDYIQAYADAVGYCNEDIVNLKIVMEDTYRVKRTFNIKEFLKSYYLSNKIFVN